MTFWNLAYTIRYFLHEKTCLGLVMNVWLLFYKLISHFDINHLTFPKYHHTSVWHSAEHVGWKSSGVCSSYRGILFSCQWHTFLPVNCHSILFWRNGSFKQGTIFLPTVPILLPRPKHKQKAQDSQSDLLPRVLISSRGTRECISVGIKSFTWWHLEDSVRYHLLLLPSEQCCFCQSLGLAVVPQPSLKKKNQTTVVSVSWHQFQLLVPKYSHCYVSV